MLRYKNLGYTIEIDLHHIMRDIDDIPYYVHTDTTNQMINICYICG